jgi:beta-aspartyl-peptidase (threonine type)
MSYGFQRKRCAGHEAAGMVKHFFPRAIALVIGCLLIVTAQASAADDRTELTAFMNQSASDWNAGHLDAFMRGYENAPSTIYVGAKTIFHGYAAIRGHYASHYGKTMGVLSFSDLTVRPLGADYAAVVAHWHLAMTNGTHPTGIFSLVLHRVAGAWHIILDHSP